MTNVNNWDLIPEEYHDALTFLQAPPTLEGLLNILSMTLQSLTTLQSYTQILPNEVMETIPDWQNNLTALEHFCISDLKSHNMLKSHNYKCYGILTKKPVYSTFSKMVEKQKTSSIHTNIEILSSISAIYTYCHSMQFDQGIINKKTTSPYEASVDIRQLIESDEAVNLLRITQQTTHEEFITNLSHLITDQYYGDYYDGIERLVRLISLKKGGRNRHVTESKQNKEIRTVHFTPDPEDNANASTTTVIEVKSTSDTEEQYNSVLITTSDSKHLPAADQSRRHRGAYNSIVKSNQQLRSSKSVVSDIDLYHLLLEILALAINKSKYQFKDKRLKLEFPILLSAMVWLGRPIKEILTLKKLPTRPDNPSSASILYIERTNRFIVSAMTAKVKKLNQIQSSFLGDPLYSSHLELSNPVSKGNIISSNLKNFKTSKGRYFTHPLDSYTEELSKFTRWMRRRHKTHLTTLKIQKIIYNQILNTTHSQLIAYHITGSGEQQAKASSYYLSIDKTELEETYRFSTDELKKRIMPYFKSKKTEVENEFRTEKLVISQTVGSQIKLETATIALLVRHLKQKIRDASKLPISDNRIILKHNSLTLYIVMMFFYLTGCRPVDDPLENIKHIDWTNNLIIISDKDNDNEDHTRKQPMPKVLRDQLSYYIDYLASLATMNPLLQETIKKIICGDHDTPFLFFLTNKRTKPIKRVTPGSIATSLEAYPLPWNTHRHYLYTRLHELQVQPEFISYFCGHWQKGSEPHSKFSTLLPHRFCDEITQALTVIACECEWSVVTGEQK